MKLGAREIRKIGGSLAVLALVAAIAAAAGFAASRERRAARADLVAATALRNDAQARLRMASSEEQEIKQKAALFQALQARGIIGDERRLDWVELLREVRERHRLFAATYEISPQQKIDSAGGFDFRTSTMRLQLPLLHEEDLLRLFADVQQQASALIVPAECAVSRLPRGGDRDAAGLPPQLRAECSLRWITVAPSKPG